MLIPSPRFWFLLALSIPLALGGAFIPRFELVSIVYTLFLSIAMYVTYRLAKNWEVVRVKRWHDPVLSVNTSNRIRLVIENLTMSSMTLWLRDEVPDVMETTDQQQRLELEPGRMHMVSYHVTPRTRGEYQFEGTYVRYLAPFGLCTIQKKLENSAPVRIYPNVQAVREFDLLNQRGSMKNMGIRRTRAKGIGTEFESLRDYHEDDFRKIDWKASARRGKLVVKNYEQESNQTVMVCVDIGRQMLSEVDGIRKLDFCLDACLMLLHAANRAGDQMGMLLFNDVVQRYVVPKKGKHQIATIMDSLYDVSAEPVQSDFIGALSYLAKRNKRRSLIILFTDAENYDQANEIAQALEPLRRRHLIFVVRVSDPHIKELAVAKVGSDQQLYDRAAATWYQVDRRRAEMRLFSKGVESIDAEPQDLSAALVGAYLRVKERNLL